MSNYYWKRGFCSTNILSYLLRKHTGIPTLPKAKLEFVDERRDNHPHL